MKIFGRVMLALVAILLGLGFGFFSKDVFRGDNLKVDRLQTLLGGPVPQEAPVDTFQANFDHIIANYERKLDRTEMLHSAMAGLASSLGDPHTNYLDPDFTESFTMETRGDLVGIGARLSEDPLGAKIVSVFKNGPADRAGIKANDIIASVGSEQVGGTPVDDIVDKVRGEEGTTVNLKVVRDGASSPLPFSITRQRVEIPTVESKMLAGKIGYMQVSGFSQPTPYQFEEAIREAMAQGATGIIVDMRGNPGGLLEAAAEMLSLFVSDKPVVTMKVRNDRTATTNTLAGRTIEGMPPVVVLVNEESASAAEIFAGALRDYGRAVLVGEHTYGKASVQDLKALSDGASAKITIAKYLLPSGEDISRKIDDDGVYVSGGIKPEVHVKLEINENTVFGEPGKDNQLDKAIEILKGNRTGL